MKDLYVCPMHSDVTSDRPGTCPKCGGMALVQKTGSHGAHMEHDHAAMMSSPEAAKDFLRRFYFVTVLLIPLVVFSSPAVRFLGMPDFAGRDYVEFFFATVIFYFGLIFFRHAEMEIRMKKYGMMTLVSLGVGSGYLFSAVSTFVPALHIEFYLEIATLIWILLFGHFLEAKSSTAAGDALSEVAKLLPKSAHRVTATGVSDIEITDLKEKDVVLVKAGEKVPADGVITKGSANFNESHISGESRPVKKSAGTIVVAGAINLDGSVEVKLTRVGASSTIGQIKSLIANAKKTKPSAQKLADRAAGWLTFSALSVSVIALIFWSLIAGQPLVFAATLAITVLVIACPHALGLAIPTVSTIATKLAVQNGVFIKDMAKIEVIKKATYVVFDKTGTLTRGTFGVTGVTARSGTQNDLLSAAAALEAHSSHVIAAAIISYAKEKKLKIPEAKNIKSLAGKGITGTVNGETYLVGNRTLLSEYGLIPAKTVKDATTVYVATPKKLLGSIYVADTLKPESKTAVDALHRLGIRVAMLTGDTPEAAAPVARALGIDTVFARVLPEEKYRHIKNLQDQGNIVVMAGDGVNDAPALAQADAGVSIGAGTDVAAEAGDVILTQSNPEHLVRLIVLSRKVYRKMLENLIWAAGYNIVAIPAAAGLFIPFGFRLTPAVGALFMSLSSVIVVINAMSLRHTQLSA